MGISGRAGGRDSERYVLTGPNRPHSGPFGSRKDTTMTNEILGWIISFAILTAAVSIRAIYLAVQDKVNKNIQ